MPNLRDKRLKVNGIGSPLLGAECTQQMFIRRGFVPRFSPLPFYISFFYEKFASFVNLV